MKLKACTLFGTLRAKEVRGSLHRTLGTAPFTAPLSSHIVLEQSTGTHLANCLGDEGVRFEPVIDARAVETDDDVALNV
jgi:hypothetical protein